MNYDTLKFIEQAISEHLLKNDNYSCFNETGNIKVEIRQGKVTVEEYEED